MAKSGVLSQILIGDYASGMTLGPLVAAFLSASLPTYAAPDGRAHLQSSAYTETALPRGFAKLRPAYFGWPKGMAPLPKDFFPIRVEKRGLRVVAISDSRWSGYWVHLSDDAGKHWRHYFANLPVHRPYTIFSTSNLPLMRDDSIVIEVERTGPEGPMHPRTADLALRIPLATLTADRDRDGISDLLAHHLKLDRPSGESGAPLRVGPRTDAGPCPKAADSKDAALSAIIEKMVQFRDLTPDWNTPLLLQGDPQAFACVRSRFVVLVYDGRSAHNLPVTYLGPIRFDETGKQGTFSWLSGSWRVDLRNGKWDVEPVSVPIL